MPPKIPRARSARFTSSTVRPVSPRSTTNSLKNGPSSAGAANAGQLAEPLRRVVRALHDALAELGEALRADEREVGAGRDRPQELRRPRVLLRVAPLHVGRPLPDDLPEPVLALDDRRAEADQERRVLGDEALLVGRGDEAGEPAAVVHVDSERLELPADDVGAVARRSVEDAERRRVDADDEEGARVVGEGGQLGHLRLDRPEVARASRRRHRLSRSRPPPAPDRGRGDRSRGRTGSSRARPTARSSPRSGSAVPHPSSRERAPPTAR